MKQKWEMFSAISPLLVVGQHILFSPDPDDDKRVAGSSYGCYHCLTRDINSFLKIL